MSKRKIKYIYNLKEENIKKWFNVIVEITELCSWNQKQVMLLIKTLIVDTDFDKSKLIENYVSNKQLIYKFIYPSEKTLIYLKKIDKCKQIHFYYSKDFTDAVERHIEAYSVSCGLNAKETKRKYEETLITGLGTKTRLEICKLGLIKPKDIIILLTTLNKNFLLNVEENRTEEKRINTNKQINKMDKYCKYHKSFTHSTSECRSNFKPTYIKLQIL